VRLSAAFDVGISAIRSFVVEDVSFVRRLFRHTPATLVRFVWPQVMQRYDVDDFVTILVSAFHPNVPSIRNFI
jgi:hypothetical protein